MNTNDGMSLHQVTLRQPVDQGRVSLDILNRNIGIKEIGIKEAADSTRLLHKVVQNSQFVMTPDEDIVDAGVHFFESHMALALNHDSGVKHTMNQFYEAKVNELRKRPDVTTPTRRRTKPRTEDGRSVESSPRIGIIFSNPTPEAGLAPPMPESNTESSPILPAAPESTDATFKTIQNSVHQLSQNLLETNNMLSTQIVALNEKVDKVWETMVALNEK
eukprot:CAMPEP_0196574686 /NCGR_PEP_ID=MMETSP1081-20130531/4346_1 /TAXON_ID=36882 /ORGANISM="Pyramimonas amylifera, Strain CCMP720" /LENGTH=217 /DNA_ID=CAMNT_0041892779 /DNA_START=113 /DNA_END=763 /DNA_ORIENTATION=+